MLTQRQRDYLKSPPPPDPQIAELISLGHSQEVVSLWRMTWRDHAKAQLEAKYQFTGTWFDAPQVHNLLEGLGLKAAFRVYLEESVLWLGARNQPQEIGGGFQPGTRILVLPPTTQPETTLHEIGHVAYAAWFYQAWDLRDNLMIALKRYADWGVLTFHRWPPGTPEVYQSIWGYVNGRWQEDGLWFDGFFDPWNPDEAFASTFSACMGHLNLLPSYLRPYYAGIKD